MTASASETTSADTRSSKVPASDTSSEPRQRRPRRASISETIVDAALHAASSAKQAARLLLFDDLPPWRRDNAYVVTGYRPSSNSWRASIRSGLMSWHNETVNIWSHAAGAALFLALAAASGVPSLLRGWGDRLLWGRAASKATAADAVVMGCFFGGAVACLGMSATYHAISNHSERVARLGNKLDYSGIILLIVGSYVPALWYGFYCHPALMTFYLGTMCLLGAACMAFSWLEHFRQPEWRAYRAAMFVALGLSGVVPIVQGVGMYSFNHLHKQMGLGWVILQGALYIFGAFLYAVRWPERAFPKTFDILGSSHQIFHFFVVFAAATHLYAMTIAFDYHHNVMGSQCPP